MRAKINALPTHTWLTKIKQIFGNEDITKEFNKNTVTKPYLRHICIGVEIISNRGEYKDSKAV